MGRFTWRADVTEPRGLEPYGVENDFTISALAGS